MSGLWGHLRLTQVRNCAQVCLTRFSLNLLHHQFHLVSFCSRCMWLVTVLCLRLDPSYRDTLTRVTVHWWSWNHIFMWSSNAETEEAAAECFLHWYLVRTEFRESLDFTELRLSLSKAISKALGFQQICRNGEKVVNLPRSCWPTKLFQEHNNNSSRRS